MKKNRKILAAITLIIAIVMTMVFASCDSTDPSSTSAPSTAAQTSTVPSATPSEPTPEPTPTPTPVPDPTPDPDATPLPEGFPIADVFSANITSQGVSDKSDNKLEVTDVNDPRTKYDEKIGKYVAEFDGTESMYAYTMMDFSGLYDQLTDSFTMEVYASFNSNDAEMYCFGNLHAGGFAIGIESPGDTGMSGLVRNGSEYVVLPFGEADFGSYHHYVLTYDGTNIISYMDGNQVGTQPAANFQFTNVATAQYLVIGADSSEDQNNELFFDGNVVRANLYSTAITAEQVTMIYNAAIG